MRFERIFKPDNATLKLFIPCRKNFIYSSKSAIKQLGRIIKTSICFYKVYHDTGEFKGCLFIDTIDDENKTVVFGGFADRHAKTKQAIKELVAYIKYHYPDYKIKALTNYLTAKMSLTRAGFTKNKEGYIYE